VRVDGQGDLLLVTTLEGGDGHGGKGRRFEAAEDKAGASADKQQK
jgi:hypothetical protein